MKILGRTIISFLTKTCVTACLFILLLGQIQREYGRVQSLGKFSWPDWTVKPEQVKAKAELKDLNHDIPDFRYLVDALETQQPIPSEKWKEYIFYYNKTTKYFPLMSEAYGMLGFCYQQMGENQLAITAYQKAIALNPQFFWSYHNLGILLFKQGYFKEAARVWEKAAALNPAATLQFMESSKMFRDLWISVRTQYQFNLRQRLREGYRQAFQALTLSYLALKEYPQLSNVLKQARQSGFGDDPFLMHFMSNETLKPPPSLPALLPQLF